MEVMEATVANIASSSYGPVMNLAAALVSRSSVFSDT
jgi:hypothetical protein